MLCSLKLGMAEYHYILSKQRYQFSTELSNTVRCDRRFSKAISKFNLNREFIMSTSPAASTIKAPSLIHQGIPLWVAVVIACVY
jgi:hypothetical protein